MKRFFTMCSFWRCLFFGCELLVYLSKSKKGGPTCLVLDYIAILSLQFWAYSQNVLALYVTGRRTANGL